MLHNPNHIMVAPGKAFTKYLNFSKNMFLDSGMGKRFNIWYDNWVDNLKNCDYINNIPTQLQNLKVADSINWNTKSWKLNLIGINFSELHYEKKLRPLIFLIICTKIKSNGP